MISSRRLLSALLLLLAYLSTAGAATCQKDADCDPLFVCLLGECFCRFGRAPCTPPLFGFAPLNQLPAFNSR